ncbi:DUF3300 domain-containing protein [Lysobacter niabensis]|uniref:DUF3300 domain-containing protein n=1 Tax=Agrilutibacter niabensis TaxID=380628 RepID=UPI00361AC47A
MRISHVCALSAALLLAGSCSRETPPAPTPAAPAATTATPTAPPPAAPAAPARDAVFGREQLDQMLAPIALYSDPLLAQVLMAATYPGDVAEAAAWSKSHPDAKGDQAVKEVASQPWDPSVQSLVAFPQALATLGQDPAWVQRLGDAFLAQPEDVMDAVQRLRHQAQAAGHLESNEYQNVTVQPSAQPSVEPAMGGTTVVEQGGGASTIIIEPASPEVVYVPSYDSTQVYGTWAYPSYPPAYYPPPPGYYMGGALATGLAFGVGVAVADSLWGDFDWGGDDIDIDVDRYNNINVNNQLNASSNRWQHNSVNRDGVPYRDRASREQYSRRLDGASSREAFRGEDPQRARSREQARASMQQRGFDAPARSNLEARDRARDADRAQARDRARDTQQRTQARDRTRDTQDRTQARDRARDTQQRAQARDRSTQQGDRQQQARDRSGSSRTAADRSGQQRQRQQQQRSQSNSQARQSARQHQSGGGSRTRNNAFEGARSPSSSRAQQDRGRASHAQSRSSSSRSSGKPVNRQSHAPQRGSRRG